MKQCSISISLNWSDAETNASFQAEFDQQEGRLIIVGASHRIMNGMLDLGVFIPVTDDMSDSEVNEHVRSALRPITIESEFGSLAQGATCKLQVEVKGKPRTAYEGTISTLQIALTDD